MRLSACRSLGLALFCFSLVPGAGSAQQPAAASKQAADAKQAAAAKQAVDVSKKAADASKQGADAKQPADAAKQDSDAKQAVEAAKQLIGIWGVERVFGPEVQGELTLLREQGGGWLARISGFEAPGREEKKTVSVVLPGGQGELRGALTPDGKRFVGHWIQSRVIVGGYRYATPVELRAIQKDVWRGTVKPQEDRFTVYLIIQEAPDGTVQAVMRNPERNFPPQRVFRVSMTGNTVKLTNTREGAMSFEATFDVKAEKLSLPFMFLGTLDLTKRDREQAVGLYARTPSTGAYVYRKPVAEEDGWATASLEDVGMDPAPVRKLVQSILDTSPADPAAPLIQGLLIARHGKLVVEEYFYGFDKERAHDLRSAAKTFAPALVGLAIDQGAKLAPETPVYSLFPELKDAGTQDPRKARLTVEHLMTMTSGYACDDDNDDSPGKEEKVQELESGWYTYTLNLPMEREPGEDQAVYCSVGMNLLGAVVHNATGAWLPDLFARSWAMPLQMRDYHLNLGPEGDAYLGGGFHIRPRDALKLGQVYLKGGVWNGRRVISKSWVERSIARHAVMSPGRTYGYAWWRHELTVGGRTYAEYEAGGNGGQLIMVVPELDLTVMFAGGNYNQVKVWRKFREELLPQYILAAVRK
ncbi:serine hydrolase [Pyxidicoccus parkwayensis]|uniref:Serine hydrolase n=1 Tax=Pyxidicoccus parkwayensis TaxID=2813578 RepID=A0ABX7NJP4_9BACT|nr:serine hydrolase [Pyxidicoccus parkwaysis]QSQ18995.1 serine hydrolase [Pyxidicoccus parkwaysis]